MELSILEAFGSLGVGCILALVIFFMYRRECKAHQQQMQLLQEQYEERMREDRKFMEDRLTGLLESDQQSREAHTKVLTELITYLRHKNGKSKAR